MLGSTRVRKPLKQPRQRRAQVTFDAILDATARILETAGYDVLTTNHVAERAGVSIGTLYEYFPDKDTLVAEVIRRTTREVLVEVTRGLEAARDRPGLRRGLAVMFDAIEERKKLVRALWQVPFLQDLEEIKALPSLLSAMTRENRAAASSPLWRKNPEAASYLLSIVLSNAIVHGAAARPKHLSREDVEDTLARMLEALIA